MAERADADNGPDGTTKQFSAGVDDAQLGADRLLLRGRLGPISLSCRGDLVEPADRAEQVRLTVLALLMLPGEVRGTARENELQPADRKSQPRNAPDHHRSPAIRDRPWASQ